MKTYLHILSIAFPLGSIQNVADIEVSVVTTDPVNFTLTCTSTGGPATTVTWTREGANFNYDSNHVLTQTVTDTGTSAYSNVLTVTVVENGPYQCIVSNARGTVRSPVLMGPGKSVVLDQSMGGSN